MYFLVLFEPTAERAIYLSDNSTEKLTVKDLLNWICKTISFRK